MHPDLKYNYVSTPIVRANIPETEIAILARPTVVYLLSINSFSNEGIKSG